MPDEGRPHLPHYCYNQTAIAGQFACGRLVEFPPAALEQGALMTGFAFHVDRVQARENSPRTIAEPGVFAYFQMPTSRHVFEAPPGKAVLLLSQVDGGPWIACPKGLVEQTYQTLYGVHHPATLWLRACMQSAKEISRS